MKKLIYIASFAITLASCQSAQTKNVNTKDKTTVEKTVAKTQVNQEGYQLMKQFCFNCHFEKMDSSKREQMIAPPMRNIQGHYKPTYPNKKDFINAIVKWVNKPNEADVKMPGATRKFGLMPTLPIGDDKLSAIADALFDMDFGKSMHRKGEMRQEKITLNNGKKWQLEKEDIANINKIIGSLHGFESNDVTEYREMGKWIFDQAKKMMLNKSYDEATVKQIHNFFHKVEDDMHKLMSVDNISEGEKYKNMLENKFDNFTKFFK